MADVEAYSSGLTQRRVRQPTIAVPGLAIGFCLAIAAVFAIAPLGLGGDYPDHLARVFIQMNLAQSAVLQRYYEIEDVLVPHMAMDVVAPLLAQGLGIYGAGAVLAVLAAILAPIGGMMISRRLHGVAAGWLPLVGFMAAFNPALEYGFVNFLITVGLALIASSFWIGQSPGWRRTLIFASVGACLAGSHALGFLLFGYIVLLWEIGAFAQKERGSAIDFARRLVVFDGLAMAPGLLILLLATSGVDDLRPIGGDIDFWAARAQVLATIFRFGADGAAPFIALAALVAFLGGGVMARSRGVVIDRRMVVVCGGLAVLVALMPVHALGVTCLHFRYGAPLVILLAASVRFSETIEHSSGFRTYGAAALGLVLALQLGNGVLRLHQQHQDYHQLIAALKDLPAGARVLPVIDDSARIEFAGHAAAHAVIAAEAYVPTLYTNTSRVNVRPEWRAMHLPGGWRVSPEMAHAVAETPAPPMANAHWSDAYYYDWAQRYSHVVYLHGEGVRSFSSPHLEEVAEGRGFAVSSIRN